MSLPTSIAVFCGSRPGNAAHHSVAARELGARMADQGITLIYGGGKVGLMGEVADAVSHGGGEIIGVIPDFLMQREVGNSNLANLEVTDSMHSRKRRMFELADAFVSLAGGLGTLDETVEIITWKQLGLHVKPIVILSQDGFWHNFEGFVGDVIEAGFAYTKTAELFQVVDSVDAIFETLASARYPDQAMTDTEKF